VIKSGFESTDSLLDDVDRAEGRSAVLRVDRREQPVHERAPPRIHAGRGRTPFVNLPVNVGIIKGRTEDHLYDSGWKQLAYIFDWNTSCCWQDLRFQMARSGWTPVTSRRIVIGHGHWDHAGQLSSFPNAVLYIQKEELKQIDFFLDYPVDFNAGTSAP
jgi:glyoxylase-like metal-dependent hydrolase (beta-lactamase superfamily II)